MLALSGSALPVGPEWSYEVKWDGYRAFIDKRSDRIAILSRRSSDLTATYPPIVSAARTLAISDVLLDGEIVALDANGQPAGPLVGKGGTLFEGSVRSCLFSTIPFWGFGARVFPHADPRGDRFNLRLVNLDSVDVALHAFQLDVLSDIEPLVLHPVRPAAQAHHFLREARIVGQAMGDGGNHATRSAGGLVEASECDLQRLAPDGAGNPGLCGFPCPRQSGGSDKICIAGQRSPGA